MKLLQNVIMKVLLVVGLMLPSAMLAQEEPMASGEKADTSASPSSQEESVDVKSIVFGHIGDSYEWHITDWGDTHITIPLPVIVYSQTTGWHVFMSSRLEENGGTYQGLSIAEIAASVGFSDKFYFSRVFKKSMGMPPSRYLNSARDHSA